MNLDKIQTTLKDYLESKKSFNRIDKNLFFGARFKKQNKAVETSPKHALKSETLKLSIMSSIQALQLNSQIEKNRNEKKP